MGLKLSPGKNLSTDFTLPDEDTLKFIENHIDMLNEKLEGLGFKYLNIIGTAFFTAVTLIQSVMAVIWIANT